MTLIDRIAAYFGYVPADTIPDREYPRLNNGPDAVARGQRYEAFYAEEGGLQDMILAIRRNYFEASAALGISDTDKLYEYALADRIARELDRAFRTVIETGKLRAAEREHTDKIAAIGR